MRLGITRPTEAVLVGQVIVGCDKYFESFLFCPRQQLAVCQRTPTQLESCFHLMQAQVFAQGDRRSLVEKDAQSDVLGHRKAFGCMIENRAGLFDSDAEKQFHELSYLDSVFQVFKESRDGDARTAEHPGAT